MAWGGQALRRGVARVWSVQGQGDGVRGVWAAGAHCPHTTRPCPFSWGAALPRWALGACLRPGQPRGSIPAAGTRCPEHLCHFPCVATAPGRSTGLTHTSCDVVFNGQLWALGGAANWPESASGQRRTSWGCGGAGLPEGEGGTQLRAEGTASLWSCPSWPCGSSQGSAWGWLVQELVAPTPTPSGSSEALPGPAGGAPAAGTERSQSAPLARPARGQPGSEQGGGGWPVRGEPGVP